MHNKNLFSGILTIAVCFLILTAIFVMVFIPKDKTEVKEVQNNQVSMFSWNMELTNNEAFQQLSVPMKKLGITRIYQLVPIEYLSEPEVPVMIKNLLDMGINTSFLTGDSSWMTDGLTEYKQIVDAIVKYNQNVDKNLAITEIALDMEAHSLQEWQQNPKESFKKYIELMKQAKEYSNERGLKVIQVIPTTLDEIDSELFETFLTECCDELSIMNYRKSTALTAIDREMELCKKYNIPIETIFETMPKSEEQGVTEAITYYYDGLDTMQEAVTAIKEKYGESLGIAYHHYTMLYYLSTGNYLAEIYPYSNGKEDMSGMGQPIHPGKLLLTGEDGSQVIATPYWPKRKGNQWEYCFLAVGVEINKNYTVTRYDLFQNEKLNKIIIFPTPIRDEKSQIKLQLE